MHPQIIQGGMGVGISGWPLARAVSQAGALGTISGVGIESILARRLQDGDPGEHYRQALAMFPDQRIAQDICRRYLIKGGRGGKRYRKVPMMELTLQGKSQQGPLAQGLEDLMVVAGFAEVWLAKEGHPGPVAINLLEKVQMSLLPVLYGAMLAGVDYVLMGAGLPVQIPGTLDLLAAHQPTQYKIAVEGASAQDEFAATFDPQRFGLIAPLRRPYFFPIISIALAAQVLDRGKNGAIDGWVIEGPTAGGHNAPPRAKTIGLDGEPEYGPRDEVDLAQIRKYKLPFYLAGSYASPAQLLTALELGAAGVQVGTILALCAESGMDPEIRHEVAAQWRNKTLKIRTNPNSSPSGYPFKEVSLPGTVTDERVTRQPVCDIGILRTPYKRDDGSLGYRCPAEPLGQFLRKGGNEEDTLGCRCLCNSLFATMGCGQVRRHGTREPAVVTLGSNYDFLDHLQPGYSAQDALTFLRSGLSR